VASERRPAAAGPASVLLSLACIPTSVGQHALANKC
jgi:hypothetical protein